MHGRSIIAIGISLLLSVTLWAAVTADEEYVRIYRLVVEADGLREGGQIDPALKLYLSSKQALEQLQLKFPGWNERLLIYRLSYITGQIKSLSAAPAPAPLRPSATAPAAPAAPPSSAPEANAPPALDPQFIRLREENQALRATAARLEAKLKEALSVQPNTTDPKELAKAQDQLRELLVENQALKNTLQEEQKKIRSILVTNTVVQLVTNQTTVTNLAYVTNRVVVEPTDVVEMRKNLTDQLGAVSALKTENEVLKKELQVAKSTPPPPAPVNPNPELERQLQEALASLKSMQEANQELNRKQKTAEQLLAETKNSQASQEEKLKRFNELEQQLADSRTESQKLAAQKDALEKRLSTSITDRPGDAESTRRLVKLERDLLESQSEVRLLARQKGDLEQRLATAKTAASGAPGAATPLQLTPGAGGEAASVEVHRQLKQAAWEVLNLQAQNQELLRKQTALEQQLSRAGGTRAGFDAVDEDRLRRLEKMNQELSETKKVSMRLERENQEMARQLAESKQAQAQPSGGRSAREDALRQQVQEAQAKLRQAEEASRELARKSDQLEKQLAMAKTSVAPAAATPTAPPAATPAPVRTDRVERELAEAREQARKLEQENRNLEKKLALAEQVPPTSRRSSASKNANASRSLERELALLKSRLDVLESKAVPYTEQELALFGRLEANIASPSDLASNRAASPASGAASGSGSVPTGLMNEARADYEAGRYAQAEQKFQRLAQQDQGNVSVLTHLAAAQFALQRLDLAEKTIQQALAVGAEDPAALYILGLIRLRQDKTDEALDALSRSANANPQNAMTQNSLGVALSQKGLREPAETAFRKALQIQPDYPDAHYNLAVEYILQQPPSHKLAQWHYQKATSNGHPQNAELEKRLDAAFKAAASAK
ncbi:MAG: tetratricopeptide repeat protein [Verrucomicrobiales bacterium]|nr:tetratricopeptide repeat protein [Verrucomicrobiales bacterium]